MTSTRNISRGEESEALQGVSWFKYVERKPYFKLDEFLSDRVRDAYTFLGRRGST